MSAISNSTHRPPAALRRAERAVQEWRSNGGGTGFPVPESIWALAVAAARVVGVAEVVRVLRLNRQRLKQRLAATAPVPVAHPAETADVATVAAMDVTREVDEKSGVTPDCSATPVTEQPCKPPPCWVPTSSMDVEPDAGPTFFELRLPAATPRYPEPPTTAAERTSGQTDAVIDGAVIECSGHGEHLRIELHTLSGATLTGIVQAFWSRSCYR